MEATLSSKGQATIPKAVRDRLQLKPGDRFKFFFHPDGVLILKPHEDAIVREFEALHFFVS